MEIKTDLYKLINSTDSDVDSYLELVSRKEFINDVKDLVKNYSDKGAIPKAIDTLQNILKQVHMRTNMKESWATVLSEKIKEQHEQLFSMPAVWIDKRKICIGDELYIENGAILPKKEAEGVQCNYCVKELQGTISGIPKRITLENVSSHVIETIDL